MEKFVSNSADETFAIGEKLGQSLGGGEVILLFGGLGAGKTLFTKGVLGGLDFDIDEVTSPSFTLVNKYQTADFDIFHIDLWRLDDGTNAAFSIGLEEILDEENAIVIIEWAERLGDFSLDGRLIAVAISGDGEQPRTVEIQRNPNAAQT